MDQTTTEKMYHRHYTRMLQVACTLLYNEEEARDVVSEVFTTLLMPSDIEPKNVEGYLMAAVRNRCLNLLAHKTVRERFEHAYIHDMEKVSDASEDEERLADVLAYAQTHLTERTLQVFRMRHLDGMTYQEIADTLGISRIAVYKHLTTAMQTIKEAFTSKH